VQWLERFVELGGDWQFMLAQEGWRSAIPQVFHELGQLPYRHARFLIVARSLSEPLPHFEPKIPLDIREFQVTDLEMVRQVHRPSEANLCVRRLSHGHRGLVAMYEDRIAGYAWGCTEFEPSLERVRFELCHGDVLCVDAFTVPDLRGKGVQTALASARMRLFRELGFQRAVAYIETNNHPSLAVWRKLGSQVVAQLDFTRVGPWRRVQHTPVQCKDGAP
jgi:GNAT superfamily N-acetyltransferase